MTLAMAAAAAALVEQHLLASLDACRLESTPYRHWLLTDVLPPQTCRAVTALPFAAPRIDDTRGKRETHNSTRVFFSAANRELHPVCRDVAAAFQSARTVRRLEEMYEVPLGSSFLRIEYCQDTDGFWLEPHTDIGAKLVTLLIYLSEEPALEDCGTDIYDRSLNRVGTAPYRFDAGLMFVPGADTWHGFRRRPIRGIRRSLIVNFVKDEWRARHELAYPDHPARTEVPGP